MTTNTYGDLTPRQSGFSVAEFLKRAIPMLVIEKFGEQKPLPKNETKTIKMRRYFLTGGQGGYSGVTTGTTTYAIPLATTPLTEGTTPAGTTVDFKDYSVDVAQFGNWTGFTDFIMDTHEDYPAVVREFNDLLSEQAAVTKETLTYNVLKAGTNVFYANGTARTDVNTPITLALIRKITRALKNQNTMKITSVLASTPAFNTQPVEAAFVCLVHPNIENDIRNIDGFIPLKQYAMGKAFEGEIGTVEDVRFVSSTVFTAFPDAGGLDGDVVLSTTGTNADVYPLIFLGKNAFATIPLRGMNTAQMYVVYPKATESDPLAQRGTVGYKFYHASIITNDFAMIRGEVAATV